MDRVADRHVVVVAVVALGVWLSTVSGALASGGSVQRSPDSVAATSSSLSGVSCASANACVAVGSHGSTAGETFTLAEEWNGTNWSILPTVNPSGAMNNSLSGVSCVSTTDCTAVGSSDAAALVERWNGTSWSIEPTPSLESPVPTGASKLNAVACSLPTACVAVGAFVDIFSGPLVERWNGSGWSVQPTNMIGIYPALNGVSCSSATACTAVGNYGVPEVGTFPLEGRWDGSNWSFTQPPVYGAPYGNCAGCTGASFDLAGVSCASSTSCVAVGSDGGAAFVEGWNGASWSILPASLGPELDAVSCASTSTCMSVGSVAQLWNGTSWSTTPTPGGVLSGVSCTSANACTAVGSSGGATLAERWDGTRWSSTPTPPPPPIPTPTPTPTGEAPCVVPNVKGESRTRARKAIRAWNCALGKVKVAHKPKRKLGKHTRWKLVVTRESPSPGSVEPGGTHVRLKLAYKVVRVRTHPG